MFSAFRTISQARLSKPRVKAPNNNLRRKFSCFTPVEVACAVSAGISAYAVFNYYVCKPNQFLVRTGLGISDIAVSKSGIRWPFQEAMTVDVNPTTYQFRLHNMSKGKVEFELPVVMTIGPALYDNDPDSFTRYCKLLQDMSSEEIEYTLCVLRQS